MKGRLILYEMLVCSRRELREPIVQLAKGFAEHEHSYIKSSQDSRLRELWRYNVEGYSFLG